MKRSLYPSLIQTLMIIVLTIFTVYNFVYAQDNVDKFTVENFLQRSRISSPQLSPDGKSVVYVLGTKESWEDKREDNIWLMNLSDLEKIQLTTSEKADWSPQWSKDGSKICFLSNRTEKPQVFVININGGEASQVTYVNEGINLFRWIDNQKIAYVTNEPRDSLLVVAEEGAGGGYVVGTKMRKSALWVQSINDKSNNTKITDGSYYIADMDTDSKGRKFIVLKVTDSDLYERWVNSKIALIDKKGNELFIFKDAKSMGQLRFSPDDTKFSFVGSTVGFSTSNALFVTDVKTHKTANLTHDFDPTIFSSQWIDGETIAFSTPRHVYSGVYAVNLDRQIETLLEPEIVVNSFSINKETKLLTFVGHTNRKLSELYLKGIFNNKEKMIQITDINPWLKDKNLANSNILKYPSFDGVIIEAVVTVPPGFNRKNNYPLVVLPHGGPDGIVMDGFRLFDQLFAQEGMITIAPNFRGGIGYGSDFYRANRGKLGDIDYKDIMSGVDYLIQQGYIDTLNMVVGGWSYGGYMTNWIIGHTNRFKAAVTVAGISNTVSMYAQSDINHGEIAIWEFNGVPVLNIENYSQSSPIEYLRNCKTPTLILHGESDTRVPVAQAWEIYRALIDLNIEVELVLYPEAEHGISSPKQYADVFSRWIEWYKRYLQKQESGT